MKTGKKIYQEYCLGPCILDFQNNTRINFNDINFNLIDNKFYNKNNIINFNKINIVIFNYGEVKFWAKFYESYFPETKIYICIRIFIFCNKLIDFVLRPSEDWNVHTGNQIVNKNKLNYMNQYFNKYFDVNKNYIQNIIDELYDLCGDGLYCHDFIYVNNKLILCELGYKTLDPKLIMFYEKNKINSNKIVSNKYKVRDLYKKLLLNFK